MWDLTLTVPFGVCERCYDYDTILSCWLHRNPAWSRRCRWHWLRSAPPQPTTLAEAKRRTNPCSCSKTVDTVQCFTVADFCLQGFFTSLSARGAKRRELKNCSRCQVSIVHPATMPGKFRHLVPVFTSTISSNTTNRNNKLWRYWDADGAANQLVTLQEQDASCLGSPEQLVQSEDHGQLKCKVKQSTLCHTLPI